MKIAVLLAIWMGTLSACGVKGPPLPPVPETPQASDAGTPVPSPSPRR